MWVWRTKCSCTCRTASCLFGYNIMFRLRKLVHCLLWTIAYNSLTFCQVHVYMIHKDYLQLHLQYSFIPYFINFNHNQYMINVQKNVFNWHSLKIIAVKTFARSRANWALSLILKDLFGHVLILNCWNPLNIWALSINSKGRCLLLLR